MFDEINAFKGVIHDIVIRRETIFSAKKCLTSHRPNVSYTPRQLSGTKNYIGRYLAVLDFP